jgi:hypothetical protein
MGKIMSRLLFAAAREARIQVTNDRGGWLDAAYIPTADYKGDDFRIHPNDEHLQYGPISTALREIAFTDDCDAVDLPYIEVALLREEGHYHSTKEQFCVFLLILAECLADEGM